MKKIIFLITFISISANYCISQEIGNAGAEFTEEKKREHWHFKIAPYAWLAGTSTDVDDEQIRQSFNDLSSLTNFGFQIAGQVSYKKWSFLSNFTIAKLKVQENVGPVDVNLDIDQIIFDNKIGYLIIDQIDYESDDIIAGWAMEATIGGIYWLNDINGDAVIKVNDIPITSIPISEKQDWWDLVVGTNFRIILSKSVLLSVSGNIGGFGIANSSKFYYDINYLNTFKVSKLLTVTAGYKSFKYNRVDGNGDESVKTNVTTFGPLIGVTAHF